jgi:hypothetical protein
MVEMKAARLYTRAYLTRIRSREEVARMDDLSKIEITFDRPIKAAG